MIFVQSCLFFYLSLSSKFFCYYTQEGVFFSFIFFVFLTRFSKALDKCACYLFAARIIAQVVSWCYLVWPLFHDVSCKKKTAIWKRRSSVALNNNNTTCKKHDFKAIHNKTRPVFCSLCFVFLSFYFDLLPHCLDFWRRQPFSSRFLLKI